MNSNNLLTIHGFGLKMLTILLTIRGYVLTIRYKGANNSQVWLALIVSRKSVYSTPYVFRAFFPLYLSVLVCSDVSFNPSTICSLYTQKKEARLLKEGKALLMSKYFRRKGRTLRRE